MSAQTAANRALLEQHPAASAAPPGMCRTMACTVDTEWELRGPYSEDGADGPGAVSVYCTAHAAERIREIEALAASLADGLRRVADMVQAHPGVAQRLRYVLDGINVPVWSRDALIEFVRAGKAGGAQITKQPRDKWFSVLVGWGPVVLDVYADRDQVCERVQVGVENVTEKVKDPALIAQIPEVEVTEKRPVYEWQCSPLLADAIQAVDW